MGDDCNFCERIICLFISHRNLFTDNKFSLNFDYGDSSNIYTNKRYSSKFISRSNIYLFN